MSTGEMSAAEIEKRAQYYEAWARDIRKMNGRSVDADHADATARVLRALTAEVERLKQKLEDTETERDEALQGPWPEWAMKIEKLLRDRGLYDQWTDEYDLPADLAAHIEGMEAMLCEDEKRLRAENERLKGERDEALHDYKNAADARNRHQREIIEKDAQLERLRAAAEPFANVARRIREGATNERWLETVLFWMGDVNDPTKWSLTGRAFEAVRLAALTHPDAKDGEAGK